MLSIHRRPIFVSSFLPSDLSDLILWYEADLLSEADGDAITTWPSSAGVGGTNYDITQATTGQKPIKKIISGNHVVRFDGSDDWLRSIGNIDFSSTTFTLFAVATETSTANGDLFTVDDGGNTFCEFRIDASTKLTVGVKNTGGSNFEGIKTFPGTGLMIMSTRRTASDVTSYVNGVAGSTTSTTGTQRSGTNRFNVGQFGLGFQYYGGDCAEILYYNTDIGDTNRQAVESYLSDKYGISI